jgi:hypothetical protein
MDDSKRNINDLQCDTDLIEYFFQDRRIKEQKLRENIMKNLDSLKDLQALITSDHVYETKLYKFYHYSYKVYHLQDYTLEVIEALKKLLDLPLHTNFMRQIELGTGKQFVQSQKVDWFEETVQITNAFMHAKYMLEMILKYGVIRADGKESNFTYGWAAVLCLYNIR